MTLLTQVGDPLMTVAGLFALVLVGTVVTIFYLMPSLIARSRRHRNRMSIFVFNLFLGWTFLGWVISLVWSFSADTE